MSKEKYSLHKIDNKQYQLKEDDTLQVGMIYTDKEVGDWTISLLNEQSKKIDDLEKQLLDFSKLAYENDMTIDKLYQCMKTYFYVENFFAKFIEE